MDLTDLRKRMKARARRVAPIVHSAFEVLDLHWDGRVPGVRRIQQKYYTLIDDLSPQKNKIRSGGLEVGFMFEGNEFCWTVGIYWYLFDVINGNV